MTLIPVCDLRGMRENQISRTEVVLNTAKGPQKAEERRPWQGGGASIHIFYISQSAAKCKVGPVKAAFFTGVGGRSSFWQSSSLCLYWRGGAESLWEASKRGPSAASHQQGAECGALPIGEGGHWGSLGSARQRRVILEVQQVLMGGEGPCP